jgi:chorismate mutase
MTDQGQDPLVQRLREGISACDEEILAAFNRRLRLVAELHRHKLALDYPMVDAGREDALLAALAAANGGPLSTEGVRELFTGLIELGKREAARINAG